MVMVNSFARRFPAAWRRAFALATPPLTAIDAVVEYVHRLLAHARAGVAERVHDAAPIRVAAKPGAFGEGGIGDRLGGLAGIAQLAAPLTCTSTNLVTPSPSSTIMRARLRVT